MSIKYWAIFASMGGDGIFLSAVPENGPNAYKYDDGTPLLERFPSRDEAVMCPHPGYENRSKYYDMLGSLEGLLIVNTKVQTILQNFSGNTIEFLPITIWDSERNKVVVDYYILNCLTVVDFIDMGRSDFTMNPLWEGQIDDIDDLQIDRDSVPEDATIFRARTKLNQIFIRDDVRLALEKAGITGFSLFDADGWDGLDV